MDKELDRRELPITDLYLLDHLSYGKELKPENKIDPVDKLLNARNLIYKLYANELSTKDSEDRPYNTSVQDIRENLIWLAQGIDAYFMQFMGNPSTLDSFLGLGGSQGSSSKKAVTRFKKERINSHYIRAFHFSKGVTFNDKIKYLIEKIKYLSANWYEFIHEMKAISYPDEKNVSMFKIIRKSWMLHPSKTQHCLTEIHLMLAIESNTIGATLKKYDTFPRLWEKLKTINYKIDNNKPLTAQDKLFFKRNVEIRFKNEKEIKALCKDIKLLDKYCYKSPSYEVTKDLILSLQSKVND